MNDEKDLKNMADEDTEAEGLDDQASDDASDSDDVTLEDNDDVEVSEEFSKDAIKALKEKLKKAEKERREYLEGWQRDKADFVNAKKRAEEAQKDFAKFASESLVSDLIPVLDSFEMAMGNKEAWEKIDKNWRMGVEHIANQLKGTLQAQGLVEIDPIGQPFDHNRDEAIAYEPVEDKSQDHKVIAVIQKGYTLNGKSIRPAKVKVGEAK